MHTPGARKQGVLQTGEMAKEGDNERMEAQMDGLNGKPG